MEEKMEECDLNDSFEFVLFPALQANATERVRNTNYVKAVVNTVARSNGASYPWIIHEQSPQIDRNFLPLCDCVAALLAHEDV